MGLLGSMFGGGARLELGLDTQQGSAGGIVAGRLVLPGGKGPLRLTTLKVKLGKISVIADPESSFPKVDIQVVAEQTIAAAAPIPPGAKMPFTFRLTVPHDAEASGGGISYKVMAVADIPSVMDPVADAELTILDAQDDDQRVLPLAEVYTRFPDLQNHMDEEKLCDALYQLQIACYGEARLLMEVEPTVAHYMQHGGTLRIKRSAL
jgi:sporulation-control protein spo0M